ncbi:hypothetical protein EMPS_03496 [Entomortierella parvispora]|uniref:SLS1 N-terminal domain-containing protein n=1 Tax=Entomortierella parvispora TaxID=205924 RepID=A0A9P3H6W1_9FUNG|nr:hypothetical protein EMPS_03496 [Entomortierella parvispora]
MIPRINRIGATQSLCTSSICCASQPARRRSPKISAKKAETEAAEAMETKVIDSISRNLINDLYQTKAGTTAATRVTLEDILALKPNKKSVTPEEFEKIKDTIARSFNVNQLKGVLRQQNRPSGGKKSILINQIMLFMDLEIIVPTPKKEKIVEDPYFSAEANHQSRIFASNKRELFFILESEGDSLRQLEKEKHVRISINIADETYTIRGELEAIEEAKSRILELVAVTEEAWDISMYKDRDAVVSNPSVLEEIARRSRTFVSAGDSNTLTIAGRSNRHMEEAKRMFDLKMQKPDQDVQNLTFTHQEDEFKRLGMFPVFDSATMTLDENQKSFLRVCQIEPFADRSDDNQSFTPVQSTPSNINNLSGLKSIYQERVGASTDRFDLSAHFGQLLFQNKLQEMTLVPLPKSFDADNLAEWLENEDTPSFFSSLPFYKAVSKLPLIGPKLRTIDVEYVLSSRSLLATGAKEGPIRLTLELDNEGTLLAQGGQLINKRVYSNLMMLGQPTDIQIRGEWSKDLERSSPSVQKFIAETSLPFSNKLHCPEFFSFEKERPLSGASVSDVGLSGTHTLKSILFRTSGVFSYHGLPLIASEVGDQYGLIRRQELKLLPVPLSSSASSGTEPVQESDLTSSSSKLEHWDDFTTLALQLNKSI